MLAQCKQQPREGGKTRRIVSAVRRALLAALVCIGATLILRHTIRDTAFTGFATWIALGIIIICALWLVHSLLSLTLSVMGQTLKSNMVSKATAVAASLTAAFLLLEAGLFLVNSATDQPTQFVMPAQWEFRHLVAPHGAFRAWLWHGELHMIWRPDWQFRRSTPFPAHRDDVFRIMVVGDSFTFGEGVGAGDHYPAVLERRLKKDFRIEVLNLGFRGAQSEDVFNAVHHWLPKLKPNLVVYGICLNDFLPTGKGQEPPDTSYALPIPQSLKAFLVERTLAARFLEKAYDGTLIALGLRIGFFEQINDHPEDLESRFSADMERLNTVVLHAGLEPTITMVLDQNPVYEGQGQQLARKAENAARLAGMMVVPTEDYYREHSGETFFVSTWEIHPNIEAHQLFADMLLPAIKTHSELEAYRR